MTSLVMTLRAMTLRAMTLRVMTLRVMTLRAMTLRAMTLRVMTLRMTQCDAQRGTICDVRVWDDVGVIVLVWRTPLTSPEGPGGGDFLSCWIPLSTLSAERQRQSSPPSGWCFVCERQRRVTNHPFVVASARGGAQGVRVRSLSSTRNGSVGAGSAGSEVGLGRFVSVRQRLDSRP